MPPDGASLPRLNLQRGRALGLPSGPDVARAMEREVLTADDLRIDHANLDATPLWYYILCEAEHAGGEHLGPVGGRIVAEVIAGLLQSDPNSYLRHWPAWRPGEDGLPEITRDFNMVQSVHSWAPEPAPRDAVHGVGSGPDGLGAGVDLLTLVSAAPGKCGHQGPRRTAPTR